MIYFTKYLTLSCLVEQSCSSSPTLPRRILLWFSTACLTSKIARRNVIFGNPPPPKIHNPCLLIQVRVHFSAPDRHLRVVFPSYLREAPTGWLSLEFFQWRADGLINAVAGNIVLPLPSPRESIISPSRIVILMRYCRNNRI